MPTPKSAFALQWFTAPQLRNFVKSMTSAKQSIRCLSLLVFIFTVVTLSAQEPDKKTKVVLYKDHKQTQWDTVNVMRNCLKMNPLLFLTGEIPVYYERAISSRVSLEVAAGFTTRNYVSLSFNDEADDFGAGTKVKPQLAAHVGFRYYFTDDLEPYGLYISPQFAFRSYVKEISLKEGRGEFTGEVLTDKRVFNDSKLLFGYQLLSGTSNWLVDFYAGVGLRNRDLQKVKENINSTTNPITRTYSIDEVDDTVFAPFLGFKIGVGF